MSPRQWWTRAVVTALLVAVSWWLLRSIPLPARDDGTGGRQEANGSGKAAPNRDAKRTPPARQLAAASVSPNHPLRALPAPNTPVKGILRALQAQAAEGDAAAACRVAYELDRCRRLPQLRELPDFWRNGLDSKGPRAAEREWHIANAERNLAQAEAACEGLPEEETRVTWDYALAAALAGNRQGRWMAGGFPVGLDAAHPENTLEGWAQWREHVAAIVEAGVADGDPRMIKIAARDYLLPSYGMQVFPRDRVRALAMQLALVPAASPGYRPVMERDAQYIIESQAITPQEVEEARRFALAHPARVAPDGGFDWDRGMAPVSDASECERDR